MARLTFAKIRLPRKIIDRSDWIKYLIIPDWHTRQIGDIIESAADPSFDTFVEKHLQAYLEGKAPPDPILGAVMNIADDIVAGREPTLRAGDYIALQGEFQAK